MTPSPLRQLTLQPTHHKKIIGDVPGGEPRPTCGPWQRLSAPGWERGGCWALNADLGVPCVPRRLKDPWSTDRSQSAGLCPGGSGQHELADCSMAGSDGTRRTTQETRGQNHPRVGTKQRGPAPAGVGKAAWKSATGCLTSEKFQRSSHPQVAPEAQRTWTQTWAQAENFQGSLAWAEAVLRTGLASVPVGQRTASWPQPSQSILNSLSLLSFLHMRQQPQPALLEGPGPWGSSEHQAGLASVVTKLGWSM